MGISFNVRTVGAIGAAAALAIGAGALLAGCGRRREEQGTTSPGDTPTPPPPTTTPPPSTIPTPTPGPGTTTPPGGTTSPGDAPRSIRIAQLNAHNLFDTVNGYGSDTVLSQEQLDVKLQKLGLAIRDAMQGPDIIAMQEVENLAVLEELTRRPEIAALGYKPLLIEGTDPRGIDVAYLYRPSTVELVGAAEARGTTRVSPTGRNVQLFTRPPLVATFRPAPSGASGPTDAAAGASFTLINNHFTSKLQGADGEEKRRLQSAWVTQLASGAAGVANLDPARVIVLGDLNAGLDEDAYLNLVDGEPGGEKHFVNAADHVPVADRYSWRDGSRRSLLDHVLLTPALDARVERVEIPHINSDPSERFYEDPTTFLRASDHDPVIVALRT